MRRVARTLVLAAFVAVAAAPAAMGQADYTCTPGPVDCSGWHTTNVTLKWFPSPEAIDSDDCPSSVLLRDEGLNRWVCRELIGSNWIPSVAEVRIDKTAPGHPAPTTDRGPDSNGWYRSAVRVTFGSSDAVSGLAACTSTLYVGPDTGGKTLTGTCRDRAGNVSSTASLPLRFDATPPTISAVAPARAPDHGSWYTRPVGFSVTAADALSGLAGCDPVSYSGPDTAAATVTGACRDRAGNVATRAFSLPFDATAPQLRKVKVEPADDVVRLDWAAADAGTVEVSRSPGRGDDAHTVLYRGGGTRLLDRAVRNGRRYEYLFTAVDQAGNSATRMIAAVPGPRLLAPKAGARLSAPPVLRWTKVEGARYYNVQLLRDGRKVQSAWPIRPRLALKRSWEFRGHRRLQPGRYRWIVWPGEGPRSRRQYGRALGKRSFVIVAST